MYVPSALFGGWQRDGGMSRQLAALKAFGSPRRLRRWRQNQGGDRTLSGGASRHGRAASAPRLGGSGHVTRAALRIAERGVNNLLVHLGILPEGDRIAPDGPTRTLEVGGADYYVYTPENGLFEPLVDLATWCARASRRRASTSPRRRGPNRSPPTSRATGSCCASASRAHDARRLPVPFRDRRRAVVRASQGNGCGDDTPPHVPTHAPQVAEEGDMTMGPLVMTDWLGRGTWQARPRDLRRDEIPAERAEGRARGIPPCAHSRRALFRHRPDRRPRHRPAAHGSHARPLCQADGALGVSQRLARRVLRPEGPGLGGARLVADGAVRP